MKKLKVELVDDWHKALSWSSVRASLILAALWPILTELLKVASDRWPDFAPWVMQFFPNASASVLPAISSLLFVLFRLTQIRIVSRGEK